MRRLSIYLLSLFLFAACDELQNPDIDDLLDSESQEATAGDALHISELKFSDDYKEINLSLRLLHDVGDYDLMDSSRVAVRPLMEVQIMPGSFGSEVQPTVARLSSPSREILKKLDLKLLLLVDLSLPQQQVVRELNAAREIRAHLGHDGQGIYVAFMQGDNVSESFEATDYIIHNYFLHCDPPYIFLYRSILTKLQELADETTTLGRANHKAMIIMSGGRTWNNDMPIDPKHFALQQLLADRIPELRGKVWTYYASFSDHAYDPDALLPMADGGTDSNILQYMCKDLNGIYQDSFNWQEMEKDILKDFNINLGEFRLTLENPDGKLFRGDLHRLQIAFYDRVTGSLVARGATDFSIGSPYHPVIVRDIPMSQVIIGGLLTTLFVLLLVWIVFQILEPYIRYRWFLHKYVITWSGNKMSVDGHTVSESCYLCKGAFEQGDKVVVKCSHTMHLECWDANEYHCPEHGRHCKKGSHYYNRANLLDRHNALYYLKWVIAAIIAAFAAWLLFISKDASPSQAIIEHMHTLYHQVTHTTDGEGSLPFVYGSYLRDLPGFGQIVGFTLTLSLSLLTVRRRRLLTRLADVLIRSIIASVAGFACCLLGCLISILLHMKNGTFIIDWIPWALLSCILLAATTVHTPTRVRRSFLLAACAIAVLSVVMWAFIYYNSIISYRLSLLLALMAYTAAIAVCIAKATPRSERYFLHVEGSVKDIDIALYKWIKADPHHPITIGKSVDCTIQLSWDVIGPVAPVQAEIRRHLDGILLTALEPGVTAGDRPLTPGSSIWLYHGRRFIIGNTTFTYIEKDL